MSSEDFLKGYLERTGMSREEYEKEKEEVLAIVEKANEINYQFIMDDLFGKMYKHRTLRTLFDPGSSEYDETTIAEKIEILKKIVASKKIFLDELIRQYKLYYTKELANKAYVAENADKGLSLLLEQLLIWIVESENEE